MTKVTDIPSISNVVLHKMGYISQIAFVISSKQTASRIAANL